jgi:thiamine biosynthesis lipoprotein
MLAREAMGTVFAVTATHAEPAYAKQALRAALEELGWLEDRLSRFRPASDIGRLNRLPPGQSLTVAPETLACLQTALDVEEATRGAFGIAYASPPSAGPRIALDPATSSVRVLTAGTRLDLGAIGKGFALDRMAAILADWDLDGIMLWASTSTVLARERSPHAPGPPVWIGPESARRSVSLPGAAMSASGTAVQGFHIIDPRTRQPATHRTRCWAKAPTAAEADALSTAFMVMTDAGIADYCRRRPDVSAYL